MKQNPDVSIIIVSFNTHDVTLRCLDALKKTVWGAYTGEIIVVDNASADETVSSIKQTYPDVHVFKNATNIGFARGNNIGIKAAKGRYILLLNSDTEVHPATLQNMIAFMDDHPKCGASTCKLVLPDGNLDPACHRGFPTPWNAFSYYAKLEKLLPKSRLFGGYHMGYKDISIAHEVDAISGAFFLVRKTCIDDVGLLDEAYFMYAEDIDWAYRMKEKGWQIWFNPAVTTLHLKKKSGREHGNKARRLETYRYFLTNNKLFYTKHYEKKYSPVITFFVYAFYDIELWISRVIKMSV